MHLSQFDHVSISVPILSIFVVVRIQVLYKDKKYLCVNYTSVCSMNYTNISLLSDFST